jgi:RimJ/RimL family protein N-acetyltransferase
MQKLRWQFKHYSAGLAVLLFITAIAWLLWPRAWVSIEQGNFQLSATIESSRWVARSVQPQDRPFFEKLFKDGRIMPMLSDVPAFRDDIIEYIFERRWIDKWRAQIPYSGFIVIDKHTNQPIGFMRIETTTNTPGQAEISYAVLPEFQRKGLGTEMVKALVHDYAPLARDKGYMALGKPLTEIVATVLDANIASQRVVEKVGFHQVGQVLNKKLYRYQLPS